MKKSIRNHNKKGQTHGYQEGYLNEISYLTTYKNNEQVGYNKLPIG